MSHITVIHNALQALGAEVTEKMAQLLQGEPEDQLRGPFESFMKAIADGFGGLIVCTGETPLPDRIGRPDYAVHLNDQLTGYVELKAPGTGALKSRFKGHNRKQFKRFTAIPNILYTDGNEWAIYRGGEQVGKAVRLVGDVSSDGKAAANRDDAQNLERLLSDFLSWAPFIPTDRSGRIDLKGFAAMLAPLCRMLRDDVADALDASSSPLVDMAADWRSILFPDAPDDQFADAYAQTVTFALLLGRSEGANPLTLKAAINTLLSKHSLLSRALEVLTDPAAQSEIKASVDLLLRVIAAVPPRTLAYPEDPWLYFYEDFLAVYDPKLRKDAGAYYTPIEVVRYQVRLIDHLLVNRLGKPLGFADSGVITLDPATGTGTYLLMVIEHALSRIEKEQGAGAVPGQATALAQNLYGFELMVGPYAVSELRISRALRDREADLPEDGINIYLTDSLESPNAEPQTPFHFYKPIAKQHAKALEVKNNIPVIVCLGNPPYDRHEAASGENRSRTGGWVRWGDTENAEDAILKDFRAPAIAAGHGLHVKNLYNLYVYFWRWALYKVFEHETALGPGVVSFISASSYLDGSAFCGMRQHLREICDEIWILDLGGEGRGTRKNDNVFSIQTPVAIAVAVRYKEAATSRPAVVHYSLLEGDRDAKLAALDGIDQFSKVEWRDCPDDWQAPFRPEGIGGYFQWPPLTDLMPWQHSGCEIKRTWPICHDPKTLKARWNALIRTKDRASAFKETRDRDIHSECKQLSTIKSDTTPINELSFDAPVPPVVRYAFRSFDRQWVFADNRLGDYFRPPLWRTHGPSQVYIASSLILGLGTGPSLSAASSIPDRHYFSGRGGKDILPLYRTQDATEANLPPGILDLLTKVYHRKLTPEDFLAYVYGVLAHPAFTAHFHKELESRELRVPITRDASLFEAVRKTGARLLWLHTYGERFVPKGMKQGQVPRGEAKCTRAVPGDPSGYPETFGYAEADQTLRVGSGEFTPVSREVYDFEVSGLKVVQSWLKYRIKNGAGKKSSPLDDIRPERWTSQHTTELLELLWVLEETVKVYPEQERLLEAVVNGDCLLADELPDVSPDMRKPPRPRKGLENLQMCD
jgi:hypothetical protein